MIRKDVEFYLSYFIADKKYPLKDCYVYETVNSEFCVFDFGNGLIAMIEFPLGCFDFYDFFEDQRCLNRVDNIHYLISGECVNRYVFVSFLKQYRKAGLL